MSAPPVLSTAGFSILQNEILLNPNISIEAKSALTLLKYFDRGNGRGCFARKETLCHFLSISPYRLRKALVELAELDLITITKRGQGNPDLIQVVPQEEPQEPEQLQVEVELQEESDYVAEELPGVTFADLPEPLEESHVPEVNEVEIQIGEILSDKHYREKDKIKNINTLPCDENNLISYFFELKEGRQPTRAEIHNWTPTAQRLLEEFSYKELIPAVENAVEKGAKLFYFTALTAPSFILDQRQKRQIESDRLKHAEKALKQNRQQAHRLSTFRRSAAVYDGETKKLLTHLEECIRPQSFRTWFKDTFIVNSTESSITLAVVSHTAAQWVEEHYSDLLKEASGKAKVEVISAEEEAQR